MKICSRNACWIFLRTVMVDLLAPTLAQTHRWEELDIYSLREVKQARVDLTRIRTAKVEQAFKIMDMSWIRCQVNWVEYKSIKVNKVMVEPLQLQLHCQTQSKCRVVSGTSSEQPQTPNSSSSCSKCTSNLPTTSLALLAHPQAMARTSTPTRTSSCSRARRSFTLPQVVRRGNITIIESL
jgi:hypothetical protein